MSNHRAINGGLDQYFTPAAVAQAFTRIVATYAPAEAQWIEPSAGAGAFKRAANALGIEPICFDLEPRFAYIKAQDWLAYQHNGRKPVVVFGNPPFGFAASMAVRFFNHAARFAEVIAFVLPGSFAKESVQARLNSAFLLVHEEKQTIDFEFPEGGTKPVPCVLQVWKKAPPGQTRTAKPKDFGEDLPIKFIKPAPKRCIVAIRRVGGRAGQIIDTKDGSENTTYFLECDAEMLAVIKRADFTRFVNDTAGVRSLSKQELIRAIREAM